MEAKIIGFPDDRSTASSDFLSNAEAKELDRIIADERVVGFALIGPDGEEIAVDGLWADVSPAIFANVLRLAQRIGSELGEDQGDPVIFVETRQYEIAAVTLTKSKAVIIRSRNTAKRSLSDVG